MRIGATAGGPRVSDADQFRAGACERRKPNFRRPQGATHLDQKPAWLASAAGRARALIGVSQRIDPRADPVSTSLKTAATGAARTARIERVTRETSISIEVNLDGTGRAELATGVPF